MGSAHFISLASRVPKTGVTVSRHTGDDGTYQKGVNTLTRLIDNLDGTYTDRATGLMWVKAVAGMITTQGIRTDNTAVPKGNWGNSTTYAQGDLVRDSIADSLWICLVAHTSVAGVSDWAQNHAYTIATVVKDPTTLAYYSANSNFTSLLDNFIDFQGGFSYTAGDIIHGSLTGNYYQAQSSHTSVSQPSNYNTGTGYSGGDYITEPGTVNIYQATSGFTSWGGPGTWNSFTGYSNGDIILDPDDSFTIFQANQDFTSGGAFDDDLGNGYWTQIGGVDNLFQVAINYAGESGYWNYVTNNLFEFDRIFNTWTDVGSYPFQVELTVFPSRWNTSADIYSFSYERSSNPTYWLLTTFTNSATVLTSPFTAPYTSMLTAIEALTYAGYSDWRMPNAGEYQTIMDWNANTVNSLLTAPGGLSYWTSTPYNPLPTIEQLIVGFGFLNFSVSASPNGSSIPSLIVRGG